MQSYKLVSLVTHLGPSQNCGHYTAIGQAPNSNYYQFDDSSVRPLPLSAVLGTNAYIMFFERDNTVEETSTSSASTSSAVYGPQLPDNILNRDKSPLKLTFFRNDDRKLIINNRVPEVSEGPKPDVKPIILNSTLSKTSETNNANPEPWVVKLNGEVEKVVQPKILNGIEKTKTNLDDEKTISFVLKKQADDGKLKLAKSDSDLRLVSNGTKTFEKPATGSSKLVRPAKSPLEKLEEQMNKNDCSSNHFQKNGNGTSRLVPYDSESSGDERNERLNDDGLKKPEIRKPKPSRCQSPKRLIITTKSMHHAWTVSSENCGPLLSPSLNGDTIKK